MSTNSLPSKQNSRRSFLHASVGAGVTATLATAAYPALGSARAADPAAAPLGGNFERDFELDEITIDGAQKAFQSGQYS
ncbi:MAG: hypothetical protein ABR908_07340, partial [Terriglobales bacterium]